MKDGFEHGKRLGLVIRSEHADQIYTTSFIKALFEREGEGLFDVRGAILGHVQQGGDPSPFDRIQATRLAWESVTHLVEQAMAEAPTDAMVGLHHGKIRFTPLSDFPTLVETENHRPREQGWMALKPVAEVMAGTSR